MVLRVVVVVVEMSRMVIVFVMLKVVVVWWRCLDIIQNNVTIWNTRYNTK